MNRRLQHGSVAEVADWTRWAAAVSGTALVVLLSGCATSHPTPLLVEHARAASLSEAAPPALQLKLVTYNIWGLPSWMTGARSGRYPRIAQELQRLDPDIALLQEAWTARARTAVPTNGLWAMARGAGQHTFFQQSGLVTLSKFPILGGQFYPFSHAAFPDRFVNKGVLKVSVLLPDGQVLNVWNVHLQDGGSGEVRRSQICELVAHVEAAEDGQIADLVGGDFNCAPETPLYRQLAEAFGPSVGPFNGQQPFVTWDGLSADPRAGQTLDYVFLRPRSSLQGWAADTRVAFTAPSLRQRLSDHLGVEADIHLNAAPAMATAARRWLLPAPVVDGLGRVVYAHNRLPLPNAE